MTKITKVRIRWLLAVSNVVNPRVDVRQEVGKRAATLSFPGKRTVQDCKGELEKSGKLQREVCLAS